MPKISIVILTYNSSKHISKLLNSIKSTQNNINNLEIIVVDNASDDDTLQLVERFQNSMQGRLATTSTAGLEVRELPKNIGFAAGINIGASLATGENLLFLNPDTKVVKGQFEDMLKLFEKDNLGIVGGQMMNGETRELSVGKELSLFNTTLLLFGLDEKFGARFSPGATRKVGFVSGGFMMIRKKLFEGLRGFDEDYFMYIEDADICKRANLLGKKTFFTPKVVVEHALHGSSNREFAIKNICKGLLIYHKKHSSSFAYLIVKFLLKLKAYTLVIIGKVLNNKYLVDAYIDVARL